MICATLVSKVTCFGQRTKWLELEVSHTPSFGAYLKLYTYTYLFMGLPVLCTT